MADAAIARTGGLSDITGGGLDILKLIQGVRGTSSTTQSNISKVGMDALVKQILGSAQGLSTVASGGKGAGLYNSTSQQQLLNDLITKSAGQLAVSQAGTTTKTKGALSGGDLGSLLATAGLSAVGGKLLGPTIKTVGNKLGLDSLGNSLEAALFGSSGPVGSAIPGAGAELAGLSNAAIGVDATGNALAASLLGGESIGAGLGAGFGAAAAGEAAAGLGAYGASLTGAEVASTALGLDIAGTTAAAAGGTGAIASAAAGIGEFLTSIFALFSDERLKTDVKQVGKTEEGQPIYTYKYINDPFKTHMGVMAQETLKYHPEAVHKHSSGALMVNYDKILGV